MAAEGRNLLEVVLSTDIAKKFNEVDNSISKLQTAIETAASSANKFAEALKNAASSFGDTSRTGAFVENIQKLIETLNSLNTSSGTRGIEQAKDGIESIGRAAILDIDSVQKLIDAINKIPEAFSKANGGSSMSGASKNKNVLDSLLFDTKDLQAKREELAALLAEFETKIKSIGGKFFDVGQLIGTGGIDSAKRLQSVIENLQKSIANTQVNLENTTKRFFSGSFEGKYKEFEKMDAAYIRLQNRLNDLQQKLQSAETLSPLLKEFNAIREEYLQTTADLNTFVQKNNKITEAQKTIEGYKKELEGMANAFERMKASGKAFTSKGGLTDEAQKLLAAKQALEEKIRLYQMSADEAIKQEQKKNAEIEKEEKAASQRLKALYDERLKLEQAIFETRQKANTSQSSDSSYYENLSKLAEKYDSRIKEIDREIKDIEADYARAGIEAKEAYDTKAIKQAIEQEEKREKAIDKTTKSLKKLKETKRKQSEEERNNKIGLLGGDKPRTIREYEIAINNLRREIKNLDVDTQKGQIKEYNKRIAEYKKKVDAAIGSTNRFRQENMKLKDVLQRVAGAFGIYIGLQSITNFARNVVQVTGEFEIQHRAMQAIIGDIDAANKLWDKTVALAVKSPYRVKDLVQYTKQLAAYRVETDKLYDTTKMLADISSGLGVDMQRLILVYGQVKAANYLRGQELRQFSEAGINILGELSKYFEEINGQAVSTGEVFDMVSKRMVKFEDVAEVLKRLTEEGGIFFNMQEIQAETLRGKMMNLKDSFDIMMNSIGEKNKGVIVGFVDSIKKIVDNWEDVATILKTIAGLLITFKVVQVAGAVSIVKAGGAAELEAAGLGRLGATLVGVITRTQGATAATKSFSTALKGLKTAGGWIGLVVSLLATAGVAIYNIYQNISESDKQFRESTAELRARITDTNAYSNSLISLTTERKKLLEVENRSEEQQQQLEDIEKKRKDILNELIKINPSYGKSLKDIKDDTDKLIAAEKEELATLNAILGVRKLLNSEGLKKASEEFMEASDNLEDAIGKIDTKRKDISNYIANVDEAGKVTSEFLGSFSKEAKETLESMGVWQEMNDIVYEFAANSENLSDFDKRYETFSKRIRTLFDSMKRSNNSNIMNIARYYEENMAMATSLYDNYESSLKKAEKASDNLFEQFDKVTGGASQTKMFFDLQDAFDAATNEEQKQIARNKLINFWIGVLDDQGYQGKLRSKLEGYIVSSFGKRFGFSELKTTGIIGELLPWQKRVNIALDKIQADFDKKAAEMGDNAPVISLFRINDPQTELEKGQKEALDMLKQVQGRIASYEVDGQVAISNEEYKGLKLLKEVYKAQAAAYGAVQKSSGGGGNKALELLKKQIEAIKNASKQYEEYQKLYDDTTAFDKTKKAVQDLFGQLGIGGLLNKQGIFDKTTIQDQLKTWLSGQMAKAGKDGRIAIEKYIRELELQASQADFKRIVGVFEKNMDEAFTDYDIFKELEKIGIGGDISEAIFGISTKSIGQLKREFDRQKQILLEQYNGDDALKAIESIEKKISELEDKERVERLKKYTEYLIKGRNEAVKIYLDQLTKMADIDELHNVHGYYTEEQYKAIADQIKKETQAALDKNAWEEFKGSDFYTVMFEDISHIADSSLELMYQKLQQLRSSLNELDPTQVKEIVQQIDKIDKERHDRHPFRYLIQDIQTLKNWNKKGNATLLEQLMGDESDKERIRKELSLQVAELQAEYNKLSKDEIEGNEGEVQQQLEEAQRKLKKAEEELEKIRQRIGEINSENIKGQTAFDNILKTIQTSADYFKQMAEAAGTVTTEVMDMMDGVDDASKQLAEDIAGIAGNTAMLVSDIAKAIASEGTDVASMIDGIIRTWNIIKGIMSASEASANRIIEQQSDMLEQLEWNYERVKRASDRAWDVQSMREYNTELNKILNSQIAAYDEMIKAEESRKSPDEDLLAEYKRSRTELYEQLDDETSDFLESVGGIGVENYGEVAQGFVDAWFDAFNETGDGLEGLQEHFDEFMENIVKKQALIRIANQFLEPIFKKIDTYLNNGTAQGNMSLQEYNEILDMAQEKLPMLSEMLKQFAYSFGLFGDQAEGTLTGLQKGIQGVTEQTAEIIAAYMNSIRYYVIDTNTKLGQIISALQDSTGTFNPMVAELQNIRQQTEDIKTLLYGWRETSGTPSMRVTIVG